MSNQVFIAICSFNLGYSLSVLARTDISRPRIALAFVCIAVSVAGLLFKAYGPNGGAA